MMMMMMMMIMITSDKEKITIQDYQNSCLRYHKSYRNFLFLAVHICGIYCRIKQPLITFFNHYFYKDEFPLTNTKFRYIQCLSLQLIIFQISFDKHQAPETVAGISQRSLKDIQADKIDQSLENQSRRNNICVDSIPEDDHETWPSADIKLKENWI